MTKRDEEERARRVAAEAFDLSKAVPKGFVVVNEGKWAKPAPLSKAAKKQLKAQEKQANTAVVSNTTSSSQSEDKAQKQDEHKNGKSSSNIGT